MSTKPDPARATSPSPAAQASESLAPIAPAHQRFSPEVAAPFDQLEISSTHRKTGASGAFGGPLAPVQPSHPTGPANTRTSFSLGEHSDHTNAFTPGSYIQGTDRPLASGLPLPESSYSSPRSLDGQGTDSVLESFARRESLSLNQGGASRGRRRSLFLYQQTTRSSIDTGSAINTPESDRGHSSGYYTFAPDHSGIPPDVPSPGPHSPAFSISTFSGIIPASTSISSIIGSTQSKPPTLEFRHPITIKELETISILGPSQILAAKTLCSSRVLSRIDTIGWYSILGAQKFPAITSSQDAYDIEMATTCMSIEFGANNVQTQNFNTLILQLLSQIKLIKDQDYKGDIPSHAYNALFLTRIFLNHFITHLGPGELVSFVEGSELSAEAQQEALGVVSFKGCKLGVDQSIVSDTRSYAEQLIQGVIDIILNLDAGSSPSAYEFYEETLNLVTVMASTQIQLSTSALSENNYFLNMILQRFGPVANRLILRLLWNFTDQRPSPPHTGSLVYNAYNYLFSKTGSSPSSEPHPIADRSLLLLLLFHVQAKGDSGWDGFRKAIRSIRDERGSMADDQTEDAIFIPFRKIFHIICQQIHCEEVCLLLHVLLVENTYFRTYVLSRTDPETLYLPILRMVYEGVEGKTNYSQVYVLLVILMLFSEDEVFNDSIQKITMTYQPWFTERLLKSISLGGLAVAIVIRTIQYNLAQHKDVYFHTSSLAILANMSNSIQDIHPYVSQRLVTLFDIVARRYQKLVHKQMQQDEQVEKSSDMVIYGDMVTLVLEIINSTLTHKLKANPQLVYSLLHKQEMFAYFRNDPKFKELIQNIELAVNYFQQKVSEANLKAPTPEEVAQVIQNASRTWPPNIMKVFPDIKFQYEEEEQSSEFFCPYVWSLLYRNMYVYWDEEKAKILHEYRTAINDEEAFEGAPMGGQTALS